MNIPSHYQSAFYSALDQRDDVDLQVVYFSGASKDRAAEGWKSDHQIKPFEQFLENGNGPAAWMNSIDPEHSRIHVICGYFSSELIRYFCSAGTQWCHWSEMPGIRLAELLGYRTGLFRVFNPLMLVCKRFGGVRIRKHSLGAFGQGVLARRTFRLMGVPDSKITDLYYAPNGLVKAEPCRDMQAFSGGRKIFLAVGALCRRKGIDVLLKAFARLNRDDWCIVLCGLDKTDGEYETLVRKAGIQNAVLFLGAYPVDRIAEVYGTADVFVLPSRFDGWGAVLNEAASLGLPMIGTDLCGASWHLIEDGKTGYRVRADSVSALAAAMQNYAANPSVIDKHGRAAMIRFREGFTPVCNAARMVNALKEWLGE